MMKETDIDKLHSSCRTIYRALRGSLDEYEDLYVLIKKHPRLAEVILKAVKQKKEVYCPFPFMCKHFPCGSLSCHYDTLENGTPRRMT